MIKCRENAINQFKYSHKINKESGFKFPKYEVPWISNWMKKAEGLLQGEKRDDESLIFTTHPQVSYFQVPLLEFAPQVIDAFLNPFPVKEHNHPIVIFLRMRSLLN